MTARRDTTGEFSFAAESMAGTAAAAALRRVRALADQAPSGRMFAAIATLTEMSRRAEANLMAGEAAAAAARNTDASTRSFAKAIAAMDAMTADAEAGPADTETMPDFLRRRR